MTVITFNDFNGQAICGNINIKSGDIFPITISENRAFVCFPDNQLICAVHSDFFKDHFANNYDNQGIIRGNLAYKISHMKFNEKQKKIINERWSNYLTKHKNAILFNDLLYTAPIDSLREIIQSLKMEE